MSYLTYRMHLWTDGRFGSSKIVHFSDRNLDVSPFKLQSKTTDVPRTPQDSKMDEGFFGGTTLVPKIPYEVDLSTARVLRLTKMKLLTE